MKKGFTLIELAIALMVIGLILAMAMKGRAVVDSANIRADINKLNKISAAVTAYVSKFNSLPGKTVSGSTTTYSQSALYDDLVEEGLVSEADFSVGLEGNKYFRIASCDKPNADGVRAFNHTNFAAYGNLCVIVSELEPDSTSTATSTSTVGKLACYVETMVDDRDLTSGSGAGNGGASYSFDNCDEAANVTSYSYIVF